MDELFQIIHEDPELLVVNKPAGLVCHPTKAGPYSSLIGRVRLYLGPFAEPHLVNRLDRETSGVLVIAKSLRVASELGQVWQKRAVEKRYLAIVHGHPVQDCHAINAPLGRDEHSRVATKDAIRADGAIARTNFTVVARFSRAEGNFSLLQVWPLTGRKHQIRIHLAHLGHAIVGDKLYGGDENLYLDFVQWRLSEQQRRKLILPNQALHAAELRFEWRGKERAFEAEPEDWFTNFLPSACCPPLAAAGAVGGDGASVKVQALQVTGTGRSGSWAATENCEFAIENVQASRRPRGS